MVSARRRRNLYRRALNSARDPGEFRLRLSRAGLLAFGLILIIRLFIIQIVDNGIYRALASEQRDIYRQLFPERGEILIQDRKTGERVPLATNKDLYLVYADPRLIDDPQLVADQIAPLLGIEIPPLNPPLEKEGNEIVDDYPQLLHRLSKADDPYEPLSHGVAEQDVEKIKELRILGIDAVREPTRYYPLERIGAHVAGFVGSDGTANKGRYGIEAAFEKELAGEPGFFEGERDVAGRWIPVGRRTLKEAKDGDSVVLTIDRAIQYTACTKLNEAVQSHGAQGGSVIVMEVKTGAILAMCGAPDFDPNAYASEKDVAVFNNPAVFGQYEPGSVFKVITMAAALDTEEVTPETVYEDTGEVRIGPHTIRNSDNKAHGKQSMTAVLAESLNTGAIFAARKVGRERLRDYVERFGFGVQTGIELPGEARGDIRALFERGEIYLATASFGQGIAVTPIQIAAAVGAIAGGGTLMKPYIVEQMISADGAVTDYHPQALRQVISERASALLSGMMVTVVEGTHGRRAGVPGYYVAGKTGTAQIPNRDGGGYEPGAHIGTFAGFAPVENPEFVIVTRIDRPKDVRFAESSAAPLFGEIAQFLLQYFEVKPSRPIKN